MALSRRRFLEMLSAAGVTVGCSDWILDRLEAYAQERLAFVDYRAPGFITFSRGVCRECPNHCGIAVRKVDELPVGIRGTAWHPASSGALCVAGQSKMQGFLDPARLESPVARTDSGSLGQVVEWDQALATLGERLGRLIERGEGERIAVVEGRTSSLGTKLVESWTRSIPGARYIPYRAEYAIDELMRPLLGGSPGGRLCWDLAHTGTILLVDNEMLDVEGSPVSQMRVHGDRREDPLHDHAPTIYLGPRRGPTGIKSDYWVPCQPGQERAILLGLAEALSRDFPRSPSPMDDYSRWIPEALDRMEFARRYSLENVSRRYGLDLRELETVVTALRRFGPAVCLPGGGLLRTPNGSSHALAALALNFWTGALPESSVLSWVRDPLVDVAEEIGLPVFPEPSQDRIHEILQPLLEIKRSPVDVLVCVDVNLLHECSGRDQIERALSHVPFLVSISTYEDETSRLAHLTLPTLLDLEAWDLPGAAWAVPQLSFQVQRPCVTPAVDALSVEDIILELSSVGIAGPGFQPSADRAETLVKLAVGAIMAKGNGYLIDSESRQPIRSLGSSAGRTLLAGESIWVAENLPCSQESRSHAVDVAVRAPTPDLAPEQLWLTPFDSAPIQRGRILNRPMMMELSGMIHGLVWDSWVEIHPQDAHHRHIVNGDRVLIRGPRAEIETRAVVTRTVAPGTLSAPVGFGHRALTVAKGRGVNPLELSYAVFDMQSGLSAWGPVPVFLEKA